MFSPDTGTLFCEFSAGIPEGSLIEEKAQDGRHDSRHALLYDASHQFVLRGHLESSFISPIVFGFVFGDAVAHPVGKGEMADFDITPRNSFCAFVELTEKINTYFCINCSSGRIYQYAKNF